MKNGTFGIFNPMGAFEEESGTKTLLKIGFRSNLAISTIPSSDFD